jgi:hypothetical protein
LWESGEGSSSAAFNWPSQLPDSSQGFQQSFRQAATDKVIPFGLLRRELLVVSRGEQVTFDAGYAGCGH